MVQPPEPKKREDGGRRGVVEAVPLVDKSRFVFGGSNLLSQDRGEGPSAERTLDPRNRRVRSSELREERSLDPAKRTIEEFPISLPTTARGPCQWHY